jgi:uncharacterized protein (DUF2141 family)
MKFAAAYWIPFVVSTMICVPTLAQETTYPLTVNISGGKPGVGQAVLSLYSSSESYLKHPLREETKPVDGEGQSTFVLSQLPPGTYGVVVVHDEDNNGKLNKGFLGIPTELVGFSNNAKIFLGPPSFEETAFVLSGPLTIEVVLGKAKE